MKSCGTRGACRCHLSFNHRQIASNLSACSYGHQPVLCSAWCVEVQESSVRHYQIHQQGFFLPMMPCPGFGSPKCQCFTPPPPTPRLLFCAMRAGFQKPRTRDTGVCKWGGLRPSNPGAFFDTMQAGFQENHTINKNCVKHVVVMAFF